MMVDHLIGEYEPIFCGATILDSKHILTAASCVVFNKELISPSKVLVQAGKIIEITSNYFSHERYFIEIKFIGLKDFSKEKANQRVSAIFIHNEFDPVSLNHDIAVIRVRNMSEKYFGVAFLFNFQ